MVGQPMACGTTRAPKRVSTAASIRSRTTWPSIPAPATPCQPITSRSWASITNATRTISPFQQAISKTSEHQRRFERITTTLPSWIRPGRRDPPIGLQARQAPPFLSRKCPTFSLQRRIADVIAQSCA
jgi:hypothetical protein